MAAAIITLRLLQFCGAAVLFGSATFLLYSPLFQARETSRWSKGLFAVAATALAVATFLGFLVQTTDLAGSLSGALEPSAWRTALLQMNFGKSSLVRVTAALLAVTMIYAMPDDRRLWWACVALGALICASFAWMGHGAATDGAGGWFHLASDILHILAAAGWVGALVVFSIGLRATPAPSAANLNAALAAFSGVGTGLVAMIVLTGLVNSAYLVGWDLRKAAQTEYGQVLMMKLVAFVLMLSLAAVNRFYLTPALISSGREANLKHLRCSIGLETALAFTVLVLVSYLGTLPPVLQ